MLVRCYGAKCIGIEAVRVTVEVEIGRGIGIHLVGLCDTAVKESLLRTVTALQTLGFHIPGKKIIINLAPADLHKSGSGYDVPIAVGILAASGQCCPDHIDNYIIMGELGLDGMLRPIRGALPIAELASLSGMKGIIIPSESAAAAAVFSDIAVYGAVTLRDVVDILNNDGVASLRLSASDASGQGPDCRRNPQAGEIPDFADIYGQEGAKRGLEIAAAGAHNVIMVGAAGSGKSELAKALPGILPLMTRSEAFVTGKVYSVSSKSGLPQHPVWRRPFRAPHISMSIPALIGGGSGDNITPGEVTLANNGVLFLDEYAQIDRATAEALRAPLEDRRVTICRLNGNVVFPASFTLVAAANPCPCGYWGEGDRCTCTPSRRQAYFSRLQTPVMDRIDLQLWVHSLSGADLVAARKGESSAVIAERVANARRIQTERFAGTGVMTNAEMSRQDIETFCPLSPSCTEALGNLMDRTGLSARAYFRIIKVARTIADLAGEKDISVQHIIEAAGYRFLDRMDASF